MMLLFCSPSCRSILMFYCTTRSTCFGCCQGDRLLRSIHQQETTWEREDSCHTDLINEIQGGWLPGQRWQDLVYEIQGGNSLDREFLGMLTWYLSHPKENVSNWVLIGERTPLPSIHSKGSFIAKPLKWPQTKNQERGLWRHNRLRRLDSHRMLDFIRSRRLLDLVAELVPGMVIP